MAVLTFNNLLQLAGIDVTSQSVRLVRHHDTRHRSPTVYAAWRSPDGRDRVEEYQRIQGEDGPFDVGDILASFVVTPRPRSETLFIGLFHVRGHKRAAAGMKDPIYGNDVTGFHF